MLIEDDIREEICQELDGVIDSEFPVRSLIDYVDNGSWRTRISDVYDKVDPDYWAAVASYLKDTNTKGKEMNPMFRSMLMNIKIYGKASKKQLAWLERGIIEDYTKELGVFCSEVLRREFPESVKMVEKFLDDYVRFDLL